MKYYEVMSAFRIMDSLVSKYITYMTKYNFSLCFISRPVSGFVVPVKFASLYSIII